MVAPRHHAGRAGLHCAGHRHLAAVPGHALGPRIPGPAGRQRRPARRPAGPACWPPLPAWWPDRWRPNGSPTPARRTGCWLS